MRLTLLRHGETIENASRIIQGQLPGSLSARGELQSENAASALRDAEFDAIYSSDLYRCLQTASPIRRDHPLVPFIATTALRERHCGEYQGKPRVREFWESLPGDYEHRRYPGGESWLDVRRRVVPFLNELLRQHFDQQLLLISHGGPIRIIRSELERRPLKEIAQEGTPNAGIWHVDMDSPLSPYMDNSET